MEIPEPIRIAVGNLYSHKKDEFRQVVLVDKVDYNDLVVNLFVYLAKQEGVPMSEAGKAFVDAQKVKQVLEKSQDLRFRTGADDEILAFSLLGNANRLAHSLPNANRWAAEQSNRFGLKVQLESTEILFGFETDEELTEELVTPNYPFYEAYLSSDDKIPRIRRDAFEFDLAAKQEFLVKYGDRLPFRIGARVSGLDIRAAQLQLYKWHEGFHKNYNEHMAEELGFGQDTTRYFLNLTMIEEEAVSFRTLIEAMKTGDEYVALLMLDALMKSGRQNLWQGLDSNCMLSDDTIRAYRTFFDEVECKLNRGETRILEKIALRYKSKLRAKLKY